MRITRFALAATLTLALATGSLYAQSLSLLPGTFKAGGAPAAADRREPELNTQERITVLRERLEKARNQARRAELTVAADSAPPGAQPSELTDQVQLLRRLARTYQRHLDALTGLRQIQQSRRDLDTDPVKKLPGETPYSIDVVDGLWADVLAKRTEIETATASRRRIETLRDSGRETLEQAEQGLRQAREGLEKSGDEPPQENARARWLRNLAEIRVQLAHASIAALETDRQTLAETIDYQKRLLASLRRQAEAAARLSPLSQEDRDAKLAVVDKTRNRLKQEVRKAASAAQAALDAVQESRNGLQAARNAAPVDQLGSERVQSRLALLQIRLETRRILSETAALELEIHRLLEDSFALEETVWRQRFETLHPMTADSIKAALETARGYSARIAVEREQVQSQLNATLALVDSQQKQVDGLQPDDPARDYAVDALRAYRERIDLYQRLMNRSEALQGLLRRWQLELEAYRGTLSAGEELMALFHTLWEHGRTVWDYELFTAEDAIEVDGEIITGQRSVTVSKVLTVLLLLTLGIWLARRLARSARWLMSRRLAMHTSAALLSYRLIYIVTVLILVVFALTAFKIPFTAFAFLGGALAIGIGFGAQNLLNNFISGLILLMERPINLGDIVEVEGVRGKVTSIGARYSEVKRFDGVDILIPNSTLLEKNVTNLTLSDEQMRVSVSVGVAYGADTRGVARLIHQAVDDHGQVLKVPAPVVLLENFGESSLVFTVYFWVLLTPGGDHRVIASDVRHRIDALFREEGIHLALPRRELSLNGAHPLQVEFVPQPQGRSTPTRRGRSQAAPSASNNEAQADFVT